jgi:two-component system, NtrC family, sensor histidine kinase KinB
VLATRGTPARTVRELPLPEVVLSAIEASLRGERADLPLDLTKAVPAAAARKLLPRVVRIEGRGAVLILSDVTELVHLDEMRTELVAVASHELRTPLTTLRMTLLMLQERAASLEQRDRDLVATALIGVEQLAATVVEFLDLTRIEAGQLRLHCDRVDLRALLERAVEGIRAACNDKGVSLHFARDPRAEAVWGDVPRLTVVLSNVLNNAVKYTPPGGAIEVHASPDKAGGKVHVEVTDTGPGIAPELRERVFEKFFRVEHHLHEREGGERGAGIGLYLARQIVAAHGGSIRCDAGMTGRGACFAIDLPVQSNGDGHAVARERHA